MTSDKTESKKRYREEGKREYHIKVSGFLASLLTLNYTTSSRKQNTLRTVPPFVTAHRSAHLGLFGFLKEFAH